ncbi:MAG: DinB family protein [Planctomycetia bacterium]|nr:MAG: DinB family protein [Planctomycetia bacterium]
MTPQDAIKLGLDSAQFLMTTYLSDLSDDELRIRPLPGMNHIAWQLGHLIVSERDMASAVGAKIPELPAGFADAHTMDAAKSDNSQQFTTKQAYLELFATIRAAALASLAATPASKLSEPSPEKMRSYAPTVAAVYTLLGTHQMMHVGQWVALRRKLNKPVVI